MRPITAFALARLLGDWRAGAGPLYERLARRLAQLLADGRLAVSTRLPAERNLAAQLQISRNTATRAYAWLREHDLLESRQGSGSVTRLAAGRPLPHTLWGLTPVNPEDRDVIDLTMASCAPLPELDGIMAATLERAPTWLQGHGYQPLGLPALREAVADRYAQRGLPTRPQQIMITAGAQHALDLLARLLVRRGDVALIESPTYPGAVDALRLAGARLTSFDVAHLGWQPERIVELAAQTQAQLAYLIPDFQNPTGRLMSDEQREELMSGLRRHPVTVIADESMSELALDDDAVAAPLRAPDGACSVISVGSLSKPIWGGLRVGWVRGTERLIAALARLRATADRSGSALEQSAAVEIMARIDELTASRRALLRLQRDTVVARLREDLGWEVPTPAGGLSLWARLPAGSSSVLAEVAPRFGLLLAAGPRMSPDGALDGFIRVPYALPLRVLEDAVDRLASAYRSILAVPRADRAPLV